MSTTQLMERLDIHVVEEMETKERPTLQIPCEIYSRIVGYLRPVQNYNPGKKEEYMMRKKFVI